MREHFPHFNEDQWAAVERLCSILGDTAVLAILRGITDPQAQIAAIDSFASHETSQSHMRSSLESELKEQVQARLVLENQVMQQSQAHGNLEQRFLEQNGIQVELRNRLDMYHQELTDTQAKLATEKKHRSIKIDVSKFDGNNAGNLLRWLLEVKVAANSQRIEEESLIVAFGMSHLSGRAREWAFTKRLHDFDCFPSWETFEKDLKKMFLPPHCDFRIRSKLFACKQRNRKLNDYVQEIRNLVSSLTDDTVTEASRVTIFMQGLREGPARTQLFRVVPDTLDKAIHLALSEDFSYKNAKIQGSESTTNSDPNDMDLSNVTQFNKKNVVCYNCNRKGHMSRDCFSKKKKGSRTGQKKPASASQGNAGSQ